MKQVRKVSNLVAEELQSALKDKGITLNESAFEEKVSEIVSDIYESVNEAGDEEEKDEKVTVTEDDKFYIATKAGSVGGKDVAEGEYVEIEDTDDGKVATIYDIDGDIRESDIPVEDELDDSFEELEDEEEEEEQFEGVKEETDEEEVDVEVEDDDIDDEDDVEEGADETSDEDKEEEEVEEAKMHIKGGKKVKLTKNELKKKKAIAMGKKKEGYKWDSEKKKFVKMSAKEKKQAKLWAKKMHKGAAAAHHAKSMKKARKIAAGSNSGTVSEAFDIHSDSMTFTVEAGDVLVMEDDMLNVVREGNTIIKGIQVSEGFFDRCYEANVLVAEEAEEEETKEEETKAEECGSAKANEGKKCEGCEEKPENDKEEEETNESVATLTLRQIVVTHL